MKAAPSPLQQLRRDVAFWVGLGFFTGGLFMFGTGMQLGREELRWREQGVRAQAVVISKNLTRADGRENRGTKYLITYRYATADGQAVELTNEFPISRWEALEPGSRFPVTYLPGAVQHARETGTADWDQAAIASIMGTIFAGVGGVLTFRILRRTRREMRIIREGDAVEGEIVKTYATGTTINRVRQWRMRYRYRDPAGTEREGETGLLSPDEAAECRAGEKGVVRCDRGCPQHSVWTGVK